jgi:actin cytoskeleton-regulatory complex protein SLA1
MKISQVVKALFDYNAQSKEELSFKEDEILYLIVDSDDRDYEHQDWWLARKKQPTSGENEVGWLPSNYVAEVSVFH